MRGMSVLCPWVFPSSVGSADIFPQRGKKFSFDPYNPHLSKKFTLQAV